MTSLMISQAQSSHPLSQFNKEFSASKDLSRYQRLNDPIPVIAPFLTYLNQLQMQHFIPAKTALLLKNNLHDNAFITSMLKDVLYDLKSNSLIGDNCFSFLHRKMEERQITMVFEYLYVIMLYGKKVESHKSISPEVFQFEGTSSYSDKLVSRDENAFMKEKLSLENQCRLDFLQSWLIQLSIYSSDPAFQREIHAFHEGLKNGSGPLKPRLLYLLKCMQTLSDPIKSICFKELHTAMHKIPETEVLKELYLHLQTQQYYKQCLARVTDLSIRLNRIAPTELLHLIEKTKQAYNGCIFLLNDSKNLPLYSSTFLAAVTGEIRSQWITINHIFNRARAQYPHLLCSCHAQIPPTQQKLAEWPFTPHQLISLKAPPLQSTAQLKQSNFEDIYQDNQTKTIAIFGCNWGGGHREVTRGVSESASNWGFHPITVDLPELFINEDPVHNFFITRWLKKNWTVASLFNGLLSSKGYAIINLLRWINKQLKPGPESQERKLHLIIQHLLKINPNAVITTYSADNETIIKACKLLAIPCIHIATDIDTTVETRSTPPDFDHFYMALPFENEECTQPVQNTTKESQRIITGPPVRREFTFSRTQEDILKLKQKWGIEINKKVVIISNGKSGTHSPYPEILARHYAKTPSENIPIHLIVLTGDKKQDFFNRLQTQISHSTRLPMTILSSVLPHEMEELMSMAAYGGGLIGKAGGITLFESISRGTRMLCDEIEPGLLSGGIVHFFVSISENILRLFGFKKQLRWEQVNTNFGKKFGFVDTITNIEEFLPKLNKMLNNDNKPLQLPNLRAKNIDIEMNQLLSKVIKKAELDDTMPQSRSRLLYS